MRGASRPWPYIAPPPSRAQTQYMHCLALNNEDPWPIWGAAALAALLAVLAADLERTPALLVGAFTILSLSL